MILPGMNRARLQAGQAKIVQPYADRVHMNLDRKSPLHFRLKVQASPANYAVDFGIGSRKNEFEQLGLLQCRQQRRPARFTTRLQTPDAARVVAMDPVTQRLPIHPVHLGGNGARAPVQNHRQRQNAPNLGAVRATVTQGAQLRARVIPSAQSPTARPSDLSSTRTTPPNRSWLALDSPRESDSSGTGIRGGLPTRKPALAGFVGPYGGYPAFDRGARPRHPPHRLPSRGVSQPINATERANSSLPLSIKARILGSVSPDNPTDDGWPSGVKDGAVYAIPPMK